MDQEIDGGQRDREISDLDADTPAQALELPVQNEVFQAAFEVEEVLFSGWFVHFFSCSMNWSSASLQQSALVRLL